MDVRYPELGGVNKPLKMYKEGETMVHPSGNTYTRIGGNWVLQLKSK